jgi:hypothetical protein
MSDAADKISHPLPASVIDHLVPTLLRIYTLVHDPSGAPVTATNTKELKDAVRTDIHTLCAFYTLMTHDIQTEDFKTRLSVARTLINKLPGGDLTSKEQEEIIKMLEDMRDYKR